MSFLWHRFWNCLWSNHRGVLNPLLLHPVRNYYSHCIHNERVANSARFPRVMPRLRPCWACIDALRASAIKRGATQTNGASSHDLPEGTAGFFRPSLLPWWRLTTSHLCCIPVDHGSRGTAHNLAYRDTTMGSGEDKIPFMRNRWRRPATWILELG